ncbi:hypothetical protein A8C56_00675 [Niabella ginsenosidivorans]|uniref:Uncharacterized protein n=1 Tax=Niabella ginsenosidivorans TaxID=1176587 RepID=A0A1A9HWC5_9BACT|nr:hypothetical protein A8C56_00675 [Niabella ginsenosidivorans]
MYLINSTSVTASLQRSTVFTRQKKMQLIARIKGLATKTELSDHIINKINGLTMKNTFIKTVSPETIFQKLSIRHYKQLKSTLK